MMRKVLVPALILAALFASFPASGQTNDDDRKYDVTIVLIGLMSFDLGDSYATGDPITVLIPNLTKGAKLQSGNAKVPNHVTYLLADRDTMPESDPINRDYEFEETEHQSDNFVYLPFNGFHISIDEENDVAALNDKLKIDNSGCGECPDNDANGNSTNGKLCWLSSMQKVVGSKQEREPGRFARRAPKLSRKQIAGRMVVRYGTLAAYVVGFPINANYNEAPKFRFTADSSTHTQALAQETHWNFKARGVPFVLNLQSIKPGVRDQRVAFMPTFKNENDPGKLVIIIGNTTAKEAGPVETPGTAVKDEHYAAYYQFVKKNSDGTGPLPDPVKNGNDLDTCKQNIQDPILQTLLLDQIARGVAAPAPKFAPASARKSKAASTTHAMHETASSVPGDGAPGGLNCSGNQWP